MIALARADRQLRLIYALLIVTGVLVLGARSRLRRARLELQVQLQLLGAAAAAARQLARDHAGEPDEARPTT